MDSDKPRSVFWPVILIAIGLVWLLGNLNILPGFNFSLLVNLWPLLLIAGGLNLLIGRRAPVLRAFVALLFIGIAIAYVYLAPGLGLVKTPEVLHGSFSEPLGDAASATISIGSSIGTTHIFALKDSSALIEAEIDYIGDAVFNVSGETEKTVDLHVESSPVDQDLQNVLDKEDLNWNIGISPNVPLVLDFSAGVGEITLDLSGLDLSGLTVNSGVGSLDISLPAPEGSYSVEVSGGVGSVNIVIAEGAVLSLNVSGGVGDFVVDVPDSAQVELSASTGVGNVSVPSDFVALDESSGPIGSDGTWVSAGYLEGQTDIWIIFQGGLGGLTLR